MAFSVQNTLCTECLSRFVGASKGNILGFQRFHCPKCSKTFFYPLPAAFAKVYWAVAAILAVGFIPALGQGPAPAALDGLLDAAVIFGVAMDFHLKKKLAAAERGPSSAPEAPARPKKPLLIAGGAALVLVIAGLILLLRGKKAAKTSAASGAVVKSTASVEGVIDWAAISSGGFSMGSDAGEANEKPAHRAALKGFEMAKTPVTFGQYKRCVDAGACTPPGVSDGRCLVYTGSSLLAGNLDASFTADDLPVVCVDWFQARSFSQWVGGRLPSEAEWEYAARGEGRDVAYPWGNEPATCQKAVMSEGGPGCGRSGTAPVCSKAAGNTPQGLCDMAGNVAQWVQDWFHDTYAGAPVDGAAWENPPGAGRVFRGGSWTTGAGPLRSAARGRDDPHNRMAVLGFRPVRERRGEEVTRESSEAKTRAVILALRNALAVYRQGHQGMLPPDLAGFLAQLPERPMAALPPYHAPSAEVHQFSSLQDTSVPDTGGWGLVANSRSKDYGSVFVNCTHTDSKGSSWDSY